MTKREREREHEKSGQLFVSMVRSMLKIEPSCPRDAYTRVYTRVYMCAIRTMDPLKNHYGQAISAWHFFYPESTGKQLFS